MTIPSVAIDPFDEAFLANPYAYHGALGDSGPVVRLEYSGVCGIARFEQVKTALADHESFCSGNRSPRKWNDPASFDIERVASGHVGFGFGIHQCLGQMVARLEGEVVLNALAARIKSIRPLGAPERRLNNTLHAIAHLPVEVQPAGAEP